MSVPAKPAAGLVALLSAAARSLAEAKTAAQVLAAKERAGTAFDAARRAARLAKMVKAHDAVYSAAVRAQADALEIEARAKRRLADEYDRAQADGVVKRHGGARSKISAGKLETPSSAAEIGMSPKSVHEARIVRNALARNPAAVRDALDKMIAEGDEPTRVALRRAIRDTAKTLRDEDMRSSRANRIRRAVDIASGAAPTASGALPCGAFPIIYADPPWQNEVWSQASGHDKSPENHYPTMPLDEICDLCAGEKSPAPRDAVLYLWRTGNRAVHGQRVAEAWGFEVVSEIIWEKGGLGTGRWVRDAHEVLMICRRGSFPPPGDPPKSIYHEKKTRHSRKPAWFAELITRAWPAVPKLELFGRRDTLAPDDVRLKPENAWTLWGNEG